MKKVYLALFFVLFNAQMIYPQNRASHDLLLETCGVLSAQGVYITYGSISTLGDAYSYGLYEDELTLEILSEYLTLSQWVNEQLNTLLKSGVLNSEDTGAVIELNNIYKLLISQADALGQYIETKDESYIYVYEDSRVKAWDAIALLLELE